MTMTVFLKAELAMARRTEGELTELRAMAKKKRLKGIKAIPHTVVQMQASWDLTKMIASRKAGLAMEPGVVKDMRAKRAIK